MTSRRVILATMATALCLGGISPALAAVDSTEDTKKYCVALSSDPEKSPTAPICVWIPGAK